MQSSRKRTAVPLVNFEVQEGTVGGEKALKKRNNDKKNITEVKSFWQLMEKQVTLI